MKYDIKVIPHHEQRYDTCGDWIWAKGLKDDEVYLYIKVSELGDWRMETCCIVHELVEAVLCQWKGISQVQVDRFDIYYEGHRQPGNNKEPGDDRRAPYYWQHKIATAIEHVLAFFLGVDWKEYGRRINQLDYAHNQETGSSG